MELTTAVSISYFNWLAALSVSMRLGGAVLVGGVVYLLYRPEPLMTVKSNVASSDGDTTTAGRTVVFLLVGVSIWAADVVRNLFPMFGMHVIAILCSFLVVDTVPINLIGDVDVPMSSFIGAAFAFSERLTATRLTNVAATLLVSVVPVAASLSSYFSR